MTEPIATTPAPDEPSEWFSIAQIEEMVHQFYARVREDDLIGPVFDARVESWPPHLERMVLFWRAVLRSEPTFTPSHRGRPPTLHRAIGELEIHHFQRWLALFGEVVDGIFEPDAAEEVKEAAGRIAFAFSRHLALDLHPRSHG